MEEEQAKKDIELLDGVLLRFAMAENDQQLEKMLSSFLCPTINKINSELESTRKKVVGVLSHINASIKSNQNIKLPLQGLLRLFFSPSSSCLCKNLVAMYLEPAFLRSDATVQASLADTLLTSLPTLTSPHQNLLLYLFSLTVGELKRESEKEERKIELSSLENNNIQPLVLSYLLHFLLLSPSILSSFYSGKIEECKKPCLSTNNIKAILSKYKELSAEKLIEMKLNILEFLVSLTLHKSLIIIHLIVASCDSHYSVNRKAEAYLKKFKNHIPFEHPPFVTQMMELFQGTSSTDKSVSADDVVQPAAPPLNVILLKHCASSILSTNLFPATLSLIFQSIFGKDSPNKLRREGLLYVQWVFSKADKSKLGTFAPMILSSILKLVSQSEESSYNSEENKTRALVYSTIGHIAVQNPPLFNYDLSILEMIISKLDSEPETIRPTVIDALGSLSRAYLGASVQTSTKLEELLLANIKKENEQIDYICQRYANRLFPFSNVVARFINLLGVSNRKPEVVDEASRGLKPYVQKENDIFPDEAQSYPDFTSMLEYCCSQIEDSMSLIKKTSTSKNEKNTLPFHFATYEQIIKFLRICLVNTAQQGGQSVGEYLDREVERKGIKENVELYLKLLENGLGSKGPHTLHHVAVHSLHQLFSLSIPELNEYYSSNIKQLEQYLYEGPHESRELVAKVIGLMSGWVGSSNSPTFLESQVLKEMLSVFSLQLESENVNKIEGSCYAIGYIYCRLSQVDTQANCKKGASMVEEFNGDILSKLYNLLDHRDIYVRLASCRAVGVMSRYSALPLPNSVDSQLKSPLTYWSFVEKLLSLLKTSNAKSQKNLGEIIVMSLGYMCISQTDVQMKTQILDAIFSFENSKQQELHFILGEAMSMIGGGKSSRAAVDPMTVQDDEEEIEKEDKMEEEKEEGEKKEEEEKETMEYILHNIFKRISSDLSSLRAAACIWLLSVTKYSGRHPVVQENLSKIQMCFTRCLGDRDDVTQEAASRGLVLIYEFGDSSMKEILVESLVGNLMGTNQKKTEPKISESSQIFSENMLGEMPKDLGGGNITTYKDLCELANECGKPDLIYQFLNLASSQNLWNSRKGAGFAASALARAGSKEYLKPFLPQLLPKLYLYQYDPNPRMAQLMSNMLDSLVDPKELTLYFDQIIQDLLNKLVGRAWRGREAACRALSNILQGKRWEQLSNYLLELWNKSFRVMDDIKESVRTSALILCKTLSRISERLCDAEHVGPKVSESAVKIILPVVREQGLSSSVKEVQKFAVDMILKIVKVAGPTVMSEHVATTVSVLLEALSSLEHQAFSYASFHTEKKVQLESARIMIAQMSPLNDALELCAGCVNENNIGDLCKVLSSVIKQGVGLPTKSGAAQFIMWLCRDKKQEVKGEVRTLIRALRSGLSDRSANIRNAYCIAIASLCEMGSERSNKHLFKFIVKMYTEGGDEAPTFTAGFLLLQIAKIAPTVMKDFSDMAIPIIMLGRNDPIPKTKKIFKQAWQECGGTTKIRLYLKEILLCVRSSIQASQWKLKKQAALTLKDVCIKVKSDISDHASELLQLLIEGLKGRVWEGKEGLLDGLSALCKSSNQTFLSLDETDPLHPNNILALIANQCKKRNKVFKASALSCYASLLETFPSTRDVMFVETHQLITTIIKEEIEDEEGEEDKKDKKEKPEDSVIKQNACVVLEKMWPTDKELQSSYLRSHVMFIVDEIPKHSWKIQLALFTCLKTLFTSVPASLLSEQILEEVLQRCYETHNTKYSALHQESLEVIKEIVNTTKDSGLLEGEWERVEEHVKKMAKLPHSRLLALNLLHSLPSFLPPHKKLKPLPSPP